jgi:hypothetical protein
MLRAELIDELKKINEAVLPPKLSNEQCENCLDEAVLNTEISEMLNDSLTLFNKKFRDPLTGQYRDDLSLNAKKPDQNTNASIASAGMGVVILSLSHKMGKEPQARAKVVETLKNALGKNKNFQTQRSKHGWFRHWYDVKTGEDNNWSRGDGFSTIDTAIFVAGAQFAANYFSEDKEVQALAKEALDTVEWQSAVKDAEKGSMTLKFDLKTQEPHGVTLPFNEYILVACMGKLKEEEKGEKGAMTEFWDKHFKDLSKLPRVKFEVHSLLTDYPTTYLSSFVIQFAAYLCKDVAESKEYLQEWEKMSEADRAWFKKQNFEDHHWGLGAGEIRVVENGKVAEYYAANKINNNPDLVMSAPIIAGSIPVSPKATEDLLKLYQNKECYQKFEDLEILWRCSLKDPNLTFDKVQSIDYATFILGLSTLHPKIGGFKFFQDTLKGPPIKNE